MITNRTERNENALTCVGLMSGTSVDGVDVAIVDLVGQPPHVSVTLRYFESIPFEEEIRKLIFKLFQPESATLVEICQMNFVLGHVFGDAVLQAVSHAGIDLSEIVFVSSHGQTIYHAPIPNQIGKYQITSTLQIGESSVIAEKTGIPVISDFRVRDIAAGGQGAPLVPFVDSLLFTDDYKNRVVANIGGIANLTVVPAADSTLPCIAFDTGPGNMIIDGLVRKATQRKMSFDQDGYFAKKGNVLESYLDKWLKLAYFHENPPKSTGRELFGEQMVEQWWQDAKMYGFTNEDLIATATEYTARTFSDAILQFVLPFYKVDEVIIGGGGAYNPVLLDRIKTKLPDQTIFTQESTGIPSDAKEAIAFAVLGYECFHGRPNNLPTTTGAQHPVIMGKIVR